MVDDGSTDATAEIALRYDVRLLRAPHRGADAAHDMGARRATGDVLVFLDADELYVEDPRLTDTFPGGAAWENPDDGLAPGWIRVRGLPPDAPHAIGATRAFPKAVRRFDFLRVGGYPHAGYGEDEIFGHRLGPALVVPEARFRFTLPSALREVFRTARWIGRGPRFRRERPRCGACFRRPRCCAPHSCWRAARTRQHARGMIYDAGLVLGFLESTIRPGVRNVA